MRLSKKMIVLTSGFLVVAMGLISYTTTLTKRDKYETTYTSEKASNTSAIQQKAGTSPQVDSADQTQPPTGGKTENYTVIIENEHYKIRHNPTNGQYIITLYAIVNRPEQYDAYLDQLRQYKQEALQYLAESGTNTRTLKVIYEPDEATKL